MQVTKILIIPQRIGTVHPLHTQVWISKDSVTADGKYLKKTGSVLKL
jgi:hypothetical protein